MIAIFSDAYLPKIDGVSVTLDTLMRQLAKQGFEYDAFVPSVPGAKDHLDHIYRMRSIPAFFQPELRLSVVPEPKLLRKVLSTNYDLVHSHSPGPLGVIAAQVAFLKGIPHFHTYHTHLTEYTHYLFKGKVITPTMMKRLTKWWSNRMSYIIAPSQKMADWLISNDVAQNIRVIPSGIETARFRLSKKDVPRAFYDQFGLNPNDFIILCAGRLGKEKSIDAIISHFSKVPQLRKKRLKLLIVGDGPEKESLRQLTYSLGVKDHVVFAGYIGPSDMPKVFAIGDVFAFLSMTETQGMVVTEAIASGLPLLISKDTAFVEMIAQGENGFLIDDDVSFIQGLDQLLRSKSLREQFSTVSRNKSKRFDITTTAKDLLSYYEYGLKQWKEEEKAKHRKQIIASIEDVRLKVQDFVVELKTLVAGDE